MVYVPHFDWIGGFCCKAKWWEQRNKTLAAGEGVYSMMKGWM